MGSAKISFRFHFLLLYASCVYLSEASSNTNNSTLTITTEQFTEDYKLIEVHSTIAKTEVTIRRQMDDKTEIQVKSSPPAKKFLRSNSSLSPAKAKRLFKLSVTSDKDYNAFMASVPSNKDVWLNIQVWDPTDWTLHAILTNADRIKKLHIGGNIGVEKISDILNSTKAVTHLALSNKSKRLCSYNEMGSEKLSSTFLNATEIIILENFNNTCDSLYSGFLLGLELPNLQSLVLKNGIVNYRNIVAVRKFLVKHSKTLTHIKFKNTQIMETVFGNELAGALLFVNKVHLDYISNFVSHEFCDVLPGVQTISSSNGYMFAEQVQQLARCRKLSSIRFTIKMLSTTTFDMGIFARNSPNLQKVNITLLHDMCDNSFVARNQKLLVLENLNLLSQPTRYITIYSNCKLKVLVQSTSSKSSQWDMMSYHFYAGFYTNRSSK